MTFQRLRANRLRGNLTDFLSRTSNLLVVQFISVFIVHTSSSLSLPRLYILSVYILANPCMILICLGCLVYSQPCCPVSKLPHTDLVPHRNIQRSETPWRGEGLSADCPHVLRAHGPSLDRSSVYSMLMRSQFGIKCSASVFLRRNRPWRQHACANIGP